MIFTKGIQGSTAWLYLPAKLSDLRAKICVGNRTSHSMSSVKMIGKKLTSSVKCWVTWDWIIVSINLPISRGLEIVISS